MTSQTLTSATKPLPASLKKRAPSRGLSTPQLVLGGILAFVVLVVAGGWWGAHRASQLSVALHDDGGTIGLDAMGKLQTPERLPTEYSQVERNALATKKLPLAAGGITVHASVSAQLDGKPSFNVISPVAEVIATDRPLFRWEPLSGATAYHVEVYDRSLKKVAESPWVTQTEWTGLPLESNARYTWTVEARTPQGMVITPAALAAEAGFHIMPQDEALRLQEAKQMHPRAHLLLAALYARVGAVNDAKRELGALSAQNPGSPLVREFEASLKRQ